MKYVLIGIGTIVVIILSSIWYGYVLSIIWAWFVVKAFHVSQISIPLAMGLSTLVNMFRGVQSPSDGKNKKSVSEALEGFGSSLLQSFLLPLFALLFGYIFHLFV